MSTKYVIMLLMFTSNASSEDLKSPAQAWASPTDPRENLAERYRYLVHIDTGSLEDLLHPPVMGKFVLTASGLKPANQKQNFLNNINAIKNSPRISTSLIDQSHPYTHTAGNSGLIVEVPPEAIIATSVRDIGSESMIESNDYLRQNYPPQSADELLAQTEAYHHNEVVCRTDQLRVKGLISVGNGPVDSHVVDGRLAQLKELARVNQLPLVIL
jgi:hypothetical protein